MEDVQIFVWLCGPWIPLIVLLVRYDCDSPTLRLWQSLPGKLQSVIILAIWGSGLIGFSVFFTRLGFSSQNATALSNILLAILTTFFMSFHLKRRR